MHLLAPLDTKIVAAGIRVANMDVIDVISRQQNLNGRLWIPIGNVTHVHQSPPSRVGVEGDSVSDEIRGETRVLGMPLALRFMDENRSRQRKRLLAVKRIVGKEKSIVAADLEGA
jgi:hypothetical protein